MVSILDVILIDRVISQIINGIIRERIAFLSEGVLQIIRRKRKYISKNLVKDPTVSFDYKNLLIDTTVKLINQKRKVCRGWKVTKLLS
jgi:hypothetical protein